MTTVLAQAIRAACALAAVWVGGCSPTRSDLAQLERMPNESLNVRAEERVSCHARDLVCAHIVQMRGEACALTANDARLAPETRASRLSCALADARDLPDLLPKDAPAADQDRAALLIFDAGRSARDGGAPASLAATVSTLHLLPSGEPYARALAADELAFGVLTGGIPAGDACAALRQARQQLPDVSPGTDLASRVERIRIVIQSASDRRECSV